MKKIYAYYYMLCLNKKIKRIKNALSVKRNSRDGEPGCLAVGGGLSTLLSGSACGWCLRWNSAARASFFFKRFRMADTVMLWKKRSPTLARVGILQTALFVC